MTKIRGRIPVGFASDMCRACVWLSCVLSGLAVGLSFGPAAALEREQKAELHQAMALCVQAVMTGSETFAGWRVAKGRIPEGYLMFERFGTPDGAVRALLGTRAADQRRDCWLVFPGGPLAGVSAEAASEQIANLQTITLAGQRFVGDELGDAPALAGCLGAQQYLIWAQDQNGTMMLAVAPAQDSGGAC